MEQIKSRLLVMKIICIIIFLALFIRLAALQVFNSSHYLILSEENCTATERLWAPRGRIYDRNERVLVSNRMVYGINLEPYRLRKTAVETLLQGVAKISNSTYTEVFSAIYPQIYFGAKEAAGTQDGQGNRDSQDRLKTGTESLDRIYTLIKSYLNEHGYKFSTFSLKLDLLLYGLSQVLEVDYHELQQMVDRENLGFEPVRIYNHLSAKELVRLAAALPFLPAVEVEKAPMREYLYGSLAAHVLGYLGMINEEEWEKYSEYGYSLNERVGKTGLEREYEQFLHPVSGKKVVIVNSRGVQINDESVKVLKEPQPGADLILNIDFELQKKAEELLASRIKALREGHRKDPEEVIGNPVGGAVIVLKPEGGEVLALASYPAYDPNMFIDIKRREERQEVFKDPRQPMINRAIYSPGSKGVEPGSIFKIITAAAALEELGITRKTIVNDHSGQKVYYDPERPRKNWKYPRADGKINIVDALIRSNNIFFYDMGYRFNTTGLEDRPLIKWSCYFGLNVPTGIDLPAEGTGFVPIRKSDSLYYENADGYWVPGETLNMAIGQGRLLATPLQMANVIASIATGGKIYRPYLVKEIRFPDGSKQVNGPELLREVPIAKEHLQIIREGMRGVVQDPYGTAFYAFRDFPVPVSGKTGTAQNIPGHPAHGWFGAYAPSDDPEVVVLVFLEEGGSSSYTLPIAREILATYFGLEEEQAE